MGKPDCGASRFVPRVWVSGWLARPRRASRFPGGRAAGIGSRIYIEQVLSTFRQRGQVNLSTDYCRPEPGLSGGGRICRGAGRRASHGASGLAACLAACLAASLAALPAAAQYPGQVKPNSANAPALRAVAVVEWLGDLKHPQACRVIPVSIYDGHQLQDAGIYLAQPAPLALLSETEYELQKDGRNVGFFDIGEAAQQQNSWIGFGAYKPLPKGPTPQQLAAAAARQKVDVDDDESDEPVLHRKYHPGDSTAKNGKNAGTQGSAPDPDRPTLHRGADAGAGSTNASTDTSSDDSSAANEPPPDPDRPRLKADDDTPKSGSASGTASGSGKSQTPPANDVASVEDLPNITDPDRPRLVRGQPAEYGPSVKPTAMGLPPDMKQEVAISDPGKIAEHPWDYKWANPGDEDKMKAAMEDAARKALGLDPPPAPKAAAQRTSAHRKTAPPPAPLPAPLEDEHFRVFELEYGAGATMVLSARTKGSGAQEKFVTLIAQPDLYGGAAILVKHVTDAAHLDMNPRMHLVDAVDAENDNRGELLFELRGQTQRQFTLYRVLRGQATQIFTTGAIGTGTGATE